MKDQFDEREREIIETCDYFTACRFEGRGKYTTLEGFKSVDEAIENLKYYCHLEELEHAKSGRRVNLRDWMIYAVKKHGMQQAHIMNVNRNGERQESYAEYRNRRDEDRKQQARDRNH